jgi:hypothetical protein
LAAQMPEASNLDSLVAHIIEVAKEAARANPKLSSTPW